MNCKKGKMITFNKLKSLTTKSQDQKNKLKN